jgi:hypothetical protein
MGQEESLVKYLCDEVKTLRKWVMVNIIFTAAIAGEKILELVSNILFP